MNLLSSKFVVGMTLLTLSGLTSVASANDYLRINRDARTIERKANLLLEETEHYRATPEYLHLVNDVHSFLGLSQHITDLVRVDGCINRIAADVAQLDYTFHHIEGLFDNIERNVARGIGRKCGNTAHVKRLLNAIEDCIHHMQDDIDLIRLRNARQRRYGTVVRETTRYPDYYGGRVTRTRETYYDRGRSFYGGSSCPNSRGGVGLSIGGGSSRIHIRF